MRFALLYPAVLLTFSSFQIAFGQQFPDFKNYPATRYYSDTHAPPKIKLTADAWIYRTQIRRISRSKPNFAGHYSLGIWGCGSSCFHFAIVDVINGKVYYHHYQDCSAFLTYREISKPIDFRLDSKLLILDCGEFGSTIWDKPHYFKFERGQLIAIR